jgi:organic radical activating enzyme
MFKYIRVQIVHPCRAKCVWCSTHRKNPTFQALHDNGDAEKFHEMYVNVIERYRPQEVFVSGGEPFLYPGIEGWLKRVAAATTGAIHVFTSYQFSRSVMERVAEMELPESVVLNHTPIYFEPERWHKLTRGFPFDVYLDNVKRAARMSVKKRFKFIVNHGQFQDEIRRFRALVEPDETTQITLKFINDQGDGLGVEVMQRTSDRVKDRIDDLDALLESAGWTLDRPQSSADQVKDVIKTGNVEACPFRSEPLELRLAFYRGEDGKNVLKYRYCPYFPPDFGHKFHIGRDGLEKLGRNFKKGPFRDHCGRCRLLHYQRSRVESQPGPQGLDTVVTD